MTWLFLTFMQATVAAVAVAGETLKLARQRAGLKQVQLAAQVGATRQTISLLENRASVDDAQHLGKILEVLGLDRNGRPRGTASLVAADLRAMPVHDLIALQNQLTAEFGRRLGAADSTSGQSSRPRHASEAPGAEFLTDNPKDYKSPRTVRRLRPDAK